MRHRKKYKLIKIAPIIFMIAIFTAIYFSIYQLNKKLLPAVIAISNMTLKTDVNEVILESVEYSINKRNLLTSDFYRKNSDNISVDTVLINELCNEIAVDISGKLTKMKSQKIKIPMGVISGLEFLANIGPDYEVSILPAGSAVVDYETSFEAVGVNQVNFQIWLNVESEVQIVNPLQGSSISVKRKVSLVNTVINGDIPMFYSN